VQQPLPNNQDIQQSLEFMCTLHHIHLHHLLGQVIAASSTLTDLEKISTQIHNANEVTMHCSKPAAVYTNSE